jgi:hypothetical protein
MWIFFVPFVLAAVVLVVLVGGFSQHTAAIRRSPVVAVQATCTGKWTSGPHGDFHHAAFELLDGTRIALACSGPDYGMLAEGDVGALTYRHDLLQSFTRGMAVGRD